MSGDWFKSKYDDISERLRIALRAQGVVVLVIDGRHGTDVSLRVPEHMEPHLPALLRKLAEGLAEEIERKCGPQIVCPGCQGVCMRFESPSSPGAKPKAGDITICRGCASFLRFTSETTLRLAETAEIALMSDEDRNALVRVRREIERRK